MNKLRRSYEARVLVVPLGPSAEAMLQDMVELGLDGVMVLHAEDKVTGKEFTTRPLSATGWATSASSAGLVAVEEADMTVLVSADLAEADGALVTAVGRAAESNGTLAAALVVGDQSGDAPAANSAMVSLREAVDMVVVVRNLRLAAPFIDVLRGGPRHPAGRTA